MDKPGLPLKFDPADSPEKIDTGQREKYGKYEKQIGENALFER